MKSIFRNGLLLGCLALAVSWTVAHGAGDDRDADLVRQITELTDRVQSLERSLGVQPAQTLTPTIASRLSKTEDTVSDLQKAVEPAATIPPIRDVADLTRKTQDLARDSESMDKRLDSLESELRPSTALATEVRQMRIELAALHADVDAIDQRLTALEAKKK